MDWIDYAALVLLVAIILSVGVGIGVVLKMQAYDRVIHVHYEQEKETKYRNPFAAELPPDNTPRWESRSISITGLPRDIRKQLMDDFEECLGSFPKETETGKETKGNHAHNGRTDGMEAPA